MAGQVFPPILPISGRVTPAIFPFYTTGEDNLRVYCWNSQANVTIVVEARVIGDDGKPAPQVWTFVPTTNRTGTFEDLPLGGATILNIQVAASAGSPVMGQTYVIVQMIRGLGAAATVVGTLCSGYVTGTRAVGFPGSILESPLDGGGYYRSIVGTTPAAGHDISETVPTGARWELLSALASLTTSAAAGTRRPLLSLLFGNVGIALVTGFAFAGPNSGNVRYNWAEGWPLTQNLQYTTINYNQAATPPGVNLRAGGTISTVTDNLDVADQWGPLIYTVREWLEP